MAADHGNGNSPSLEHVFYCLTKHSKKELLPKLYIDAKEKLGRCPRVAVFCDGYKKFLGMIDLLAEFNIAAIPISSSFWSKYKENGAVLLCHEDLMKNLKVDFNELDFVINYDVPEDVQTYDKRFEMVNPQTWKGEFSTFVKYDEDKDKLRSICLKHNFPLNALDDALPSLIESTASAEQKKADDTVPERKPQVFSPAPEVSEEVPVLRSFEADETICEEASDVSTALEHSNEAENQHGNLSSSLTESFLAVEDEQKSSPKPDDNVPERNSQVSSPAPEVPEDVPVLRSFEVDDTIYEEASDVSTAHSSLIEAENQPGNGSSSVTESFPAVEIEQKNSPEADDTLPERKPEVSSPAPEVLEDVPVLKSFEGDETIYEEALDVSTALEHSNEAENQPGNGSSSLPSLTESFPAVEVELKNSPKADDSVPERKSQAPEVPEEVPGLRSFEADETLYEEALDVSTALEHSNEAENQPGNGSSSLTESFPVVEVDQKSSPKPDDTVPEPKPQVSSQAPEVLVEVPVLISFEAGFGFMVGVILGFVFLLAINFARH